MDGTYRLKVTNTGPETLVNVRINAPDFGLVDEPIPAACGDLDPGEMCIINFDDPNPDYASLKMFDVCAAPGQVTKLARVDGEGAGSGIPVSDDDPAIVKCVAEPDITLRKEVRLDDGPFLDANTVETGPSGPLGADAEYRLIVENTGTETLVGAEINDSTLGLVNVPVPGGPLAPGDTRVITQGSVGYSALFFADRCDSVGTKLNIARVDAAGELSGAPVGSEAPAVVNCEDPQIKLLKQVSLDGVNFFDADLPSDPDVPVGIVDLTDATYRLIVTKIGTEALTDVLIEDATLGISTFIADLAVGETRVIASGDTGFGNLFQPMRCGGTPGNKSNIATVKGNGASSGTPVSDDNPANVRCIEGPEIVLLKQVSLTGGEPFFDADTAATGPTELLGADATYRLIVRNVGDEALTNVTIDDSTLGISGAKVPDLPIGAEVVIDAGSFGGFQQLFFPNPCDAVGTKLNMAVVNAEGAITGEPVQDDNPANVNCEVPSICEVSVDKTCSVEPPSSDDLLCESAISATTLRYIGPSINNATVTFEGDKNGFAEYVGVDLVSGVTILTMAGQNGFTIDSGNGLGSKTRITINGTLEVIHTSCSAIYAAGQPAPLDGGTPNPPNSDKGDPSPNWFVVNFRDKDGSFVEEPTSGGADADSCTVPFGGANVTYAYNIANNGATNVDVTSVLDDLLGQQLSAPAQLAPGDTLNLTAGPVFISQDTTNVVDVSANVSGDPNATCPVRDTVVVSVEPPPQLPCSEIKPITQLSMVWGGASGVDVLTEGGQLFSNVQSGNQITFDTAGLGNDVDLNLSGAVSGTSRFHVSCSDKAMNGPEDCGTAQGDGKSDESGKVNDWLLDAMIGQNGAFICNVPNTGVVTVSPPPPCSVGIAFDKLEDDKIKWKLNNSAFGNATLESFTLVFPSGFEAIKKVKLDGDIYKAKDSPLVVTSGVTIGLKDWTEDKVEKRQIEQGKTLKLEVEFEAKDKNAVRGHFDLLLEFKEGCMVTF